MHTSKERMTSGFLPMVLALSGNLFIMILKFIGFFASGSGSMFSEAIHSLADVMNQALLLIGINLSKKKADEDFSYGYGQERFLWSLISACGIFFLGAGVTIYHGINSFIHQEEPHLNPFVFAILVVSFLIETITFLAAFKELRRGNENKKLSELLEDGDPTTIAVLYEDGVAVLGILTAFAGILLTFLTGNFIWDATGSIIIGILLGIVAVVLINKNREYLLRKNIPLEIKERAVEIIQADPAIEKVLDFKSSVLDVGCYQIKCEVEFNGSALMKEIAKRGKLKEEYNELQNDYQEFLRLLTNYADRVPRLIGSRIDRIEQKIQKELPEIKHIDIEIN